MDYSPASQYNTRQDAMHTSHVQFSVVSVSRFSESRHHSSLQVPDGNGSAESFCTKLHKSIGFQPTFNHTHSLLRIDHLCGWLMTIQLFRCLQQVQWTHVVLVSLSTMRLPHPWKSFLTWANQSRAKVACSSVSQLLSGRS